MENVVCNIATSIRNRLWKSWFSTMRIGFKFNFKFDSKAYPSFSVKFVFRISVLYFQIDILLNNMIKFYLKYLYKALMCKINPRVPFSLTLWLNLPAKLKQKINSHSLAMLGKPFWRHESIRHVVAYYIVTPIIVKWIFGYVVFNCDVISANSLTLTQMSLCRTLICYLTL